MITTLMTYVGCILCQIVSWFPTTHTSKSLRLFFPSERIFLSWSRTSVSPISTEKSRRTHRLNIWCIWTHRLKVLQVYYVHVGYLSRFVRSWAHCSSTYSKTTVLPLNTGQSSCVWKCSKGFCKSRTSPELPWNSRSF